MIPKSCSAYYYGGLPFKRSRKRGRLWIEENVLFFETPESKGMEKIHLRIPFSQMEKIFLTQDNYYGADTVLFNLSFRDQTEKSFTFRFAPITIVPRRRIALQKEWFNYLVKAINALGRASPLSTR